MATVRDITSARRARRAAEREDMTEPVAEAVDICPTCGVSGVDPCVTPSGKVKDTWHTKRGS